MPPILRLADELPDHPPGELTHPLAPRHRRPVRPAGAAALLASHPALRHHLGEQGRDLRHYAGTDLLILDDWRLAPIGPAERRDLLEILEDRYASRSTVVASQLPVESWYELIGDPTLADAILDRRLTISAMNSVLMRLRDSLRILRWSRPEQKTALLGGICFAAIAAAQWLPLGVPYESAATWVAFGLGIAFVALTIKRLWGLSLAPPSPRDVVGGAAIKGAGSFTPQDAELFSRLGRLKELKQLRSWVLDDTVPAVAVMGESGVGKTSLLRAGLTFILGHSEQPILPYAYWEASPRGAREGLLRAVEAQLGERDLDTLPPSVIAVDQLEQLDPKRNPGFFQLLREHVESEPPFTVTWVLAFRREFGSTWLDYQHGLPERCRHRPRLLSLQRLTTQQAREVFATLAEEADIPVREDLLGVILDQLAEDGSVSPVDVGVTLQVLQSQPEIAEKPAAFRSLGGPAGLLTLYLEMILEPYTPTLREEVLRSLLALIEEDENRRLADGRRLDELREIAKPQVPHHHAVALEALSQPGVRVLERIEETPRSYRLIHDRFVPALRRLAGDRLSKEDRASRLLERRFRLWEHEERQSRYLLRGRELREILKHRGTLRWGKNWEEKREFLERSRRRRRGWRVAVATGLILVALGTPLAVHRQGVQNVQTQMYEWGLSEGIYEVLPLITSLAAPPVTSTRWLSRAENLRSLSLALAPQYKAEGTPGWPTSLQEVTLEVSSQVVRLPELPASLQQLTLDLSGSQVTHLPELPASLQQLTLDLSGSQVTHFPELPADLQQLTLDLSGSRVKHLPELPTNLRRLTLKVSTDAELTRVPQLPANLEQLTLLLRGSQVTRLPELPTNLQQLTLQLANTWRLTRLPELPANLQQLTINLTSSAVTDLPELPANLRQLTLGLFLSRLTHLPDLPVGLDQLSLTSLGGSDVTRLPELPAGLRRLALGLGASFVPFPELPAKLRRLDLDLGSSQMTELPELPAGLQELTLGLGGSAVARLPELPTSLQKLSLDFRGSQLSEASSQLPMVGLPELPAGLEELTLGLGDMVPRLPTLPPGVQRLSLELRASVEVLPELPANLQELSLDLHEYWVSEVIEMSPGLQPLVLSRGSQVKRLPELPPRLRELILDLRDSQVTSLRELPAGLQELTVDLGGSDVTRLPDLPANLRWLTLDLRDSQVTSLPDQSSALQCIALEVGKGAMLLLSEVPSSVEHLKLGVGRSYPTRFSCGDALELTAQGP